LLATDGAHSTIRKMFGLKFDGETLSTNIYLCDADIEGSPQECTEALVDGENFVIIVPIRENQVRLMGNSPQYLESIPESKFKILRRNWRSEFVINNRVIEKMSLGNVYFAGDSAHVHAPLGNRGMNLGIEDVYIFAKLLEQGSVEKYNEVRHETVKRFVAKVNELCKKAFAYEKTWKKWLLPYIAPLVNQMIKNDILLFITGLDYPLPPFAKL
jgi:2-polyprenyl-6-methoxyphenol hydroxylase-like FAD-dependent oxidoreductase